MAVLEPTDPIWVAVESGLRDQWYAICVSSDIDDKPVGLTRLGERLVIWRDSAGAVQALEDRCPHRGASLALGSV